MIKRSFVYFFMLLVFFLWADNCFAHKITLFGYIDQDMVKTESKFSGGRSAKHCQITMITGTEPLFMGETDENGLLNFPVPAEKQGFDIVVTCGDGHRGSWRIETDELLGSVDSHTHTDVSLTSTAVQDDSALRLLFREELARELSPIKRQLAELKEDTVSFADIMGGLGYFLGLAGLASYMRFRKAGK